MSSTTWCDLRRFSLVLGIVVPPFLLGLAGFAASLGLAARRQLASVQADERLAATASLVAPAG